MSRTTLLNTNTSQAVRLNKDVAFPKGVREATVPRDGPRRVVVPSDAAWDDFFASPGFVLGERNQPPIQGRGHAPARPP